ncbi:MAG: dTDP-4-dehydrorhamnose reductase [Actinobacteria bacterium]|nr:dTDP-4-dehydrorhamnose reductase [Actinomycetota bacterium]
MKKLLITGANGQLGRDLAIRAPEAVLISRQDLDITDRDAVLACLYTHKPEVVIHTAAMTAVDSCESEPDRAFTTNGLATRWMVEAADVVGARLITISTDYVFSGEPEGPDHPWHEWDAPDPRSIYGASKLAGESELRPNDTIVRTAWLAGIHGPNIVKTVLSMGLSGAEMKFVDDQIGSPTFTSDLADTLLWIADEGITGIVHATNEGYTSWFGYVQAILYAAGIDPALVSRISTHDLNPPRLARRPRYSVMDNTVLRSMDHQLPHYLETLEHSIGEIVASI